MSLGSPAGSFGRAAEDLCYVQSSVVLTNTICDSALAELGSDRMLGVLVFARALRSENGSARHPAGCHTGHLCTAHLHLQQLMYNIYDGRKPADAILLARMWRVCAESLSLLVPESADPRDPDQ
jgi:hypothetical protein